MKRFFKVFLIILIVLFLTMIIVPFAFKGQLMEIAKREVNNSVKARVDWSDFNVSLFKGFPDLSVTMKNLSVTGIGPFEGDTLVAFREFSTRVDLISAISGEIRVKSIILDQPVLRAVSLSDSSVNWDITYPAEDVEEEESDTSSTSDFKIELREFIINDAEISYYDAVSSTFASIGNFDFFLAGNFSSDYTDLDVDASAGEITVDYSGIKYLNQAFLGLKALVEADLENMKFQISDNEVNLNNIILGLEGYFEMPEDESILVDVSFFTTKTEFKSLLSMIPAIYKKDFEELTTSGELTIQGNAKGKITETSLPEVNMDLMVENGSFAYPDLPESVENVNIDLNVFYDGAAPDNSRIDMDRFHLEIAGNPVDMKFRVRTPITDMQMNGEVNADVDFSTLKNAIPIEGMKLEGQLRSNIEIMGKLSDIENENYEAFKADGMIEISNVIAEGSDIPVPVNIEKLRMLFSPRYVKLETFEAVLGESDIRMDGKLENFIPFALKDDTIRGEMNVNSNTLNLNQLMASQEIAENEEEVDTMQLSVVEVPGNVDFRLQTDIQSVIYDKLEIESLYGLVIIRDGKLRMDRLNMDLLDGSMLLSGEYNTQDITTPLIELDMDMRDINIPASFEAFNTVKRLAPVAEMMTGSVSVQFDFVSFLDSTMHPVMKSIVGNGALQSDEIGLENNETFQKIGKLIGKEDLTNKKFKDIDLSFGIREGRVNVEPFDAKLGGAGVKIQGSQGLDMTMDYDMGFRIPRSQFGSSANDVLEDFASKAQAKGFDLKPGDDVNIGVEIGGTFSNPKLSLNVRESLENTTDQIKDAVNTRVQEETEKVKENVKEEVNKEIDKIMKDAEEQAEKIRVAAADAGEDLIGEAKLRKQQLIKEAGNNPLKKLAAEKTGDGLIKTAENQAETLKTEADKQAEAILVKARAKAEELKNE